MPVSKKPRRASADRGSRISFYTEAGKLLYGRLISAVTGIRYDYTMDMMMERETRSTRRAKQGTMQSPHGMRERARRIRQGVFHTQHPSVVARFASHPLRSEIDAVIAEAEAPKGFMRSMADAVLALNPLRKIEGETKSERDARIKREKRQALTLEAVA